MLVSGQNVNCPSKYNINFTVIFCQKNVSSFCKVAFVKATHIFFSQNISIYAIFHDQSYNDMLTNNIVSFEQLGPVHE